MQTTKKNYIAEVLQSLPLVTGIAQPQLQVGLAVALGQHSSGPLVQLEEGNGLPPQFGSWA